jgi:hypothetical protein
MLFGFLLFFLMQTSCSWSDSHGTHHLIVGIGFGVISETNRAGVEVRDSRVLGAELGPDFGLGLIHRHRLAIDPELASNVVVSVTSNPFHLTVKNFDPYSTNELKILNP